MEWKIRLNTTRMSGIFTPIFKMRDVARKGECYEIQEETS